MLARKRSTQARCVLQSSIAFMRARNAPGKTGEFDVVAAMYHDQGLIPVKY